MKILALIAGDFYKTVRGRVILIAGEIDVTNPLYAKGYRFFDQDLVYYTEDGRNQSVWRSHDIAHGVLVDDASYEESTGLVVKATASILARAKRDRTKLVVGRVAKTVYFTGCAIVGVAMGIEAARRKRALAR